VRREKKTFTFIYILASHNKRFCNIKKKTLTRLLSNLEDLKALHKNSNTERERERVKEPKSFGLVFMYAPRSIIEHYFRYDMV
jgi:hypothetical protein